MPSNRIVAALLGLFCVSQLATFASATTVTQLCTPLSLSATDTKFVDKDAAGATYAGPSVAFANGTGTIYKGSLDQM